jgi:hypothetical protein
MRPTNGSSRSSKGGAVSSFHRTLSARDLTSQSDSRALWQPTSRTSVRTPAAPGPGWASPMGFWFSEVRDESSGRQHSYTISIHSSESTEAEIPRNDGPSPEVGRRFRTLQARLKGNGDDLRPLSLSIRGNHARVETDEATWEAFSEPVLLAIAQVWRFHAIDTELDRLTEQSRVDIRHADLPGLQGLLRARRLADTGHLVRATILDLPQFQGALTDPLAYCATTRSARAYQLLARRLQLEPWSNAIDERATLIEAAYESITDKTYHLKFYVLEILFELVIIAILLADVLIHLFWD